MRIFIKHSTQAMALAVALTIPGFAQAAEPADLMIATAQLPPHLDPLSAVRIVNLRFTHNVLESLVRYNDHTGDFEPHLATTWKALSPTVMEFKLRDGITCHNGEVFDAEDVAIAFGPKRMAEKGAPGYSVGSQQIFPFLKKVEAVDASTVRVTTSRPDPLLLLRLSTIFGGVPCGDAFLAAKSWEQWGTAIVGTGPYKVDTFKPGEENGFKAHAKYWGAKPPYAGFKFKIVQEVGARVAGLLAGDFQIIGEITPDQFSAITKGDVARIEGGPIDNIRTINFDHHHPVLKDVRMRRAMSLAIDRKLIIDTLFAGRTEVPNGLQHKSFGKMYVEDHIPTTYDPEAARALIKAAGYKGEEISYRYRVDYYPGEVTLAQILQQMWQAVGLNIKLELVENSAAVYSQKAAKGRGISNHSATAIFQDPEIQLYRLYGPEGIRQTSGFGINERFNIWGKVLVNDPDMAARKRATARLLEIIETDVPAAYLYIQAPFYGVRKAVDWKAGSSQFMDFRAPAGTAD